MIRVLIERQIKDGCFGDYLELIRKARKQATAVSGFIAGELLQEKDKPSHAVIISSWETIDAWQDWAVSEERKTVLESMSPLLECDEKVMVLESSQLLQ